MTLRNGGVMLDRHADILAEVLAEKGKVYIIEDYIRIQVQSRNVTLIDRLERTRVGSVYSRPGGTRVWQWARRLDFRKYLPAIISRMPEEASIRELLVLT